MSTAHREGTDLTRWGLSALPGPLEVVRAFAITDPVVDAEHARAEGDAWLIAGDEAEENAFQRLLRRLRPGRRIHLFEVRDAGRENCVLLYRAELKAEDLKGRASLEMWCHLPGRGEFFSKAAGFGQVVSGTTDWVTH